MNGNEQELFFLTNLLLMLSAGIGFFYGVKKFFQKRAALFLQLITCALGCAMLGRFFIVIRIAAVDSIPAGFHVGYLGLMGFFLFLFSANYGQIDDLSDSKQKEYRKYNFLACLSPFLLLCLLVIILHYNPTLELDILHTFLAVFIAAAAYYHQKHLIIPDVEKGILQSIRGYNGLALAICFLSEMELLVNLLSLAGLKILVTILLAVGYLLLLPILARGVKKWLM